MEIAAPQKLRVNSIDILRGLVMVIMALDHVRDFFHFDAFQHDPLDVSTTTPVLFFTRYITHYCAPTFVFLAGTSAYLSGLRKSKAELGAFLIKRGLWLVIAEFVIVALGMTFDPLYHLQVFQVIWATGISMIFLGLFVSLKFSYSLILAIGLIIVFGHNLLDHVQMGTGRNFWWDLVHAGQFSFYSYAPSRGGLIVYPFLPWVGIITVGYAFGKLFESSVPPVVRRKGILTIGFSLIALFIILRLINHYGNPSPWKMQDTSLKTFLNFLDVNKYPPSLMYTCVTLGPALIFLALIEGVRNRVTAFFEIYGRVPFFYYVVHFYLIHTISLIGFYLSGYGTKDIVDTRTPFLFRPLTYGFDLWVVYLVWIGIVLLLYPLCRKFNNYKSTHRQWWLSYL